MITKITDKHELDEISKITEYLDVSETVLVVATQSRWLPGGSPVTPNTVFATDRKIIIRNPMLLGLREHVDYYEYNDIVSIKHKQGHFTSSLLITAPGMATGSRSDCNEDGIIGAVPKQKAMEIVRISRENSKRP